MDAGETFSIGFITFNKTLDTGGEWIEISVACKQQSQFTYNQPSNLQVKKFKRNPKHYENSTRNIRVMPEGNIVKVHLRLIRRFNSKIVM